MNVDTRALAAHLMAEHHYQKPTTRAALYYWSQDELAELHWELHDAEDQAVNEPVGGAS